MRDASVPKACFKQSRRRIGLHGIERLALKLLDEETGSARCGVRAKERDWFVRAKRADYSKCVSVLVQLKGPPKNKHGKTTRLPCGYWKSPWGSGGCVYVRGSLM